MQRRLCGYVVNGRHEHDRNAAVVVAQPHLQLPTVHDWHLEVEQHDGRRVLCQAFERPLTITGSGNHIAFIFEGESKELANTGIVVDNQNAFSCHGDDQSGVAEPQARTQSGGLCQERTRRGDLMLYREVSTHRFSALWQYGRIVRSDVKEVQEIGGSNPLAPIGQMNAGEAQSFGSESLPFGA